MVIDDGNLLQPIVEMRSASQLSAVPDLTTAAASGEDREQKAVVGAFGCVQLATAIALGRLRPWSRWCCWLTSSISCFVLAWWLWRADDDPIFLVVTLFFVALFHFWGCASLLQRRARQAFVDAHQRRIDYVDLDSEDLGTW